MNNFTDIREIAENKWQAKYYGNYGIYTVKLTLDADGKRTDFSCSCPSDYYPCKHIAMMERAVSEQKKRMAKIQTTAGAVTVEELLKRVSYEELQQFVIRQSKYNLEFANALMMEFLHKAKDEKRNPYYTVLHNALKNISLDYEDYYDYEYGFEIEPLNEWMERAEDCLKQEKYEEALLICQACIEEFAGWYENTDADIRDNLSADYSTKPFEILQELTEKTSQFDRKIYDYCKQEMQKSKYYDLDDFNDLLAILAPKINPEEFIDLQDSLLKQISDKSSYEAKKILERKIQFYHSVGQPEKAEEIIENNLQIERFCRQAVEKRIANKQYEDAKSLISNYLKKYSSYSDRCWDEYLLDIAQKEKDMPTIRKISFKFIHSHFDTKYYAAYRSTFTPEEWLNELEILIRHYEKNDKLFWGRFNNRLNFSISVANVLLVENAAGRLLAYLEKCPDVELVEKYYNAVANEFPERTLLLFRKTLDDFAVNNTGRDKYEYIKSVFKKIEKIKGGKELVNEMVANYRAIYKNRRAMLEILGSF